jgi:hypothetical protein
MRRHALISFLAALCWTLTSRAADKPVVFNHIVHQRTEVDNLVHEHFDKLYDVVDIDDRQHAYVPPKGIHGFGVPPAPVYFEGRCIRGNVLVLYLITTDGLMASPYVAKSADPRLSELALERMRGRRFKTAQLDGKPISSVAATVIKYSCPA